MDDELNAVIESAMEDIQMLRFDVGAMEDEARRMGRLREIPMLQLANEAEKIDWLYFSDTAFILYRKFLKLHILLFRQQLINKQDEIIVEGLDKLRQEVSILSDRLTIATNVRDTIYEEAKKIQSECAKNTHS
jgi:hypothetical protein